MKSRHLGLSAALFSALFFASYSVLGKILLESLNPITLLAASQLSSVVFLTLFFGLLPELKILKKLSRKKWVWLIIIATLSGVVAPLLVLTGLEETSAVNAVMLGRLEVAAAVLISIAWLKEKVSHFQMSGFLLMLGGVILVTTEGFRVGLDFSGGDTLVIGAALIWAFSNVLFKRYLHHLKPQIMVLVRNILGAATFLFLAPFFASTVHDFTALNTPENLLILIAFSIFSIILAQFLWYRSLDLISTTLASSISVLIPLFGVVLAVLILNEQFFIYHLSGSILVLLGLIFTVIHRHRHPEKKPGLWRRLMQRFSLFS